MKPSMILLISSVIALLLLGGSLQAQQAPVLKQKMGAADFHQAGLEKLSPAELEHLQQWLTKHAAELVEITPASEVASAKVVVDNSRASTSASESTAPAASKKANRTVVSPIAGSFSGWRPGTVIVLQNGQKWRISDDSSLVVPRPLESPVATVKHGVFGGWIIKVDGYNTSGRVQPEN